MEAVSHQRKLRLRITSQDKVLPGILSHLFNQANSKTSDLVMVKGSIWFRMKHATSSFPCWRSFLLGSPIRRENVFFQASFHYKAARRDGCLLLAPNTLPEHWKRAYSSNCSFHLSNWMYQELPQLWPSSQEEDSLLSFFLAQLEDFKSVPIWVFFQSQLCLRGPSKVLLLPCETSRHASSFNTDRNRLAQLTGLLLGTKIKIFREGMHPNDRGVFTTLFISCGSIGMQWECC